MRLVAEAAGVEDAEVELAVTDAVFGRPAEPLRGSGVIRLAVAALGEQHGEIMHGAGVAGFGRALGTIAGRGRSRGRRPTPFSYIEPSRYCAERQALSAAFSNHCAAALASRTAPRPSARRAPISYWALASPSSARRLIARERVAGGRAARRSIVPVGVGSMFAARRPAGAGGLRRAVVGAPAAPGGRSGAAEAPRLAARGGAVSRGYAGFSGD